MNENLTNIHFDAGESVVPTGGPCRLPRTPGWGEGAPSMGGAYADEQTPEQFARSITRNFEEIRRAYRSHI